MGDAYYANSMFSEAMRTFEDLGKSETDVVEVAGVPKGDGVCLSIHGYSSFDGACEES